MNSQTGSNDRRQRRHMVNLRVTAMELAHLRVLARRADCESPAQFLRQLFERALEQAKRDLQRF